MLLVIVLRYILTLLDVTMTTIINGLSSIITKLFVCQHVLRELPSSPVPASCCTALLEAYSKFYSIDLGSFSVLSIFHG